MALTPIILFIRLKPQFCKQKSYRDLVFNSAGTTIWAKSNYVNMITMLAMRELQIISNLFGFAYHSHLKYFWFHAVLTLLFQYLAFLHPWKLVSDTNSGTELLNDWIDSMKRTRRWPPLIWQNQEMQHRMA